MKNLFTATIMGLVLLLGCAALSQPLYNIKSVDKTALSYFDGLQTFRASEGTITADPQSAKVCRLQLPPENGFPELNVYAVSQSSAYYFDDMAPYDDQYNNPTQFLSSEAVQFYYGFQVLMKEFDKRFGWKGPDGVGGAPVKIHMRNSDEETKGETFAFYVNHPDPNLAHFEFGRSWSTNQPFLASMDIMVHEFTHSVIRHKTGITLAGKCNEFRALNEGICDIFGIYVKNRIKQSTPQNYNWLFGEQVYSQPMHLGNPKSVNYADTYNGQYFTSACKENYEPVESSGVVLKWFYLLSSGFSGTATNDLGYQYSNLNGIGVEKAIQILWDALPNLKSFSTFLAFKEKTLDAAKQLHGANSPEYQAVEKAWCAVGVCDNNLPLFSLHPAHGATDIEPWPTTGPAASWDHDPRIKELEFEMAYDYKFTNPQVYKVNKFDWVFKPGGSGMLDFGGPNGFFRPGETVYVRAKITQADPNFCKGLNPLCKVYQQFSPTHVFKLSDKKVSFWPAATSTTIHPWNGQLTWKSVNDAQLYFMQIASDESFNSIIYEGFAPHTGNFMETGIVNATLEIGQTYYARVRAKRLDNQKLKDNNGAYSNILTVKTAMPSTAVIQAKTQKSNDPPMPISSLGRIISWDPVPGADGFIVEVAKDDAFNNMVSSVTLGSNSASTILIFPPLPNLTKLYIRVRPKKGLIIGVCSHFLRAEINETAALPVMQSPVNGTNFPFKNFAATGFGWKSGTLNMNTVHHFELHIFKDAAGLAAIFTTPGKDLQLFVQDPLIFNAKNLKVSVLAVNELGAKTALSLPFNYPICPDHPAVFFPGDLGKVDPTKNFLVEWHPSESFVAGSQYLVTIKENGSIAVPGFTDKPTTAHSMLVPAGTLVNGKNYTVTVRNSSSCPAILLPSTFFSAIGQGSSNQPQPPKLVNFNIEIKGFRNDPDAFSIPPAFGTSNYDLGIEFFEPNGAPLALLDPNMMPVNKLAVDSENSGVVLIGSSKPQGKYKLRLKLDKIHAPNTYYPLDQPRFSVFLNGKTIVLNHIITFDIFNPGSAFDEWQDGFQFADIILDIK